MGKSGKKYKKKQDAIKQMKAIFANGYVQKHAALNGNAYNDINNKGSLYMTYKDVYNMIKQAAEMQKAPAKPVAKPAVNTTTKAVSNPQNDDFDPRYEAKKGDTASGIHQMAGGNKHMPREMFYKEFKRQNGLKDINKIKAGGRYYVPGK